MKHIIDILRIENGVHKLSRSIMYIKLLFFSTMATLSKIYLNSFRFIRKSKPNQTTAT